jgi:hypothetical protein
MFDIFFISRGDHASDVDFNRLKERCPWSKKVDSFQTARNASTTRLFWAVWPDVIVSDDFTFDYRPPHAKEEELVHIWPNSSDTNMPSIGLFPKNRTYNARELEYRFFDGMIKMNSIATYTRYYDIVFLSFNEETADKNFKALQDHPTVRYNRIHRIDGVRGIAAAHKAAAKKATTAMFWVVDADAVLETDFDFQFLVTEKETDIVHVWRSKNPVTDITYGHGGVKLLPTKLTLAISDMATDITTSISSQFKAMPDVSNIEEFNTSPLNTWRTAFRECAKLASRSISGQVESETTDRLKSWLYIGGSKPFGEYSKAGASAGKWFGETHRDNLEEIAKINDYDWLELQFNEHTKLFNPLSFKDLADPDAVEVNEKDRINWWRTSFREAANTTTTDRLEELLYRGTNEYTRSGASAGKWWGETYRGTPEKMEQIQDDKFLEGEFYWHTSQYPIEQFK